MALNGIVFMLKAELHVRIGTTPSPRKKRYRLYGGRRAARVMSVRHASDVGETLDSLIRASSAVNCQLNLALS